MTTLWALQSLSFVATQPPSSAWLSKHHHHGVPPISVHLTRQIFFLPHPRLVWNLPAANRRFNLRAAAGEESAKTDDELPAQDVALVARTERDAAVVPRNLVVKLHGTLAALPRVAVAIKSHAGSSFFMWVCMTSVLLFVAVRAHLVRKSKHSRQGSVAELVRRGQLRYDRRGITKPLKYEDPFNNPLVKVGKSNSTVEMCGKVYRLAPVTLTEEEQAVHQKRRSRAYQWKRPTIFLKEGESVPPDVDPDTVRWIPANHPFATTASDIDEDLAQNNVYQQHGVPFRIQAEHEALQRKLQALQHDQKFNKLVIDSGSVRDFERPFKFNPKSNDPAEKRPINDQPGDSNPSKSDSATNSNQSSSSLEEM